MDHSPWELGQGIWGSTLLPLLHHVWHRAAWWRCDQWTHSSIRQQNLATLPLAYSWEKFSLTCTKRHSSSIAVMSSNWKQPECPSVAEQTSQLWCAHHAHSGCTVGEWIDTGMHLCTDERSTRLSKQKERCREIHGRLLHLHEAQQCVCLGIQTCVLKLSRKAKKWWTMMKFLAGSDFCVGRTQRKLQNNSALFLKLNGRHMSFPGITYSLYLIHMLWKFFSNSFYKTTIFKSCLIMRENFI